jgi:hypothetical protein
LPALLRLLLFAARQIVGDVDYNITKISIDGRKVSLLNYKDFDGDPHPELLREADSLLRKGLHESVNILSDDLSDLRMLYPCGGFADRLNDVDICVEQRLARNPLAHHAG